ncbi:MAG: Protein of unknown function DUF664, partial [uncultured Pseudonocardia sp.]
AREEQADHEEEEGHEAAEHGPERASHLGGLPELSAGRDRRQARRSAGARRATARRPDGHQPPRPGQARHRRRTVRVPRRGRFQLAPHLPTLPRRHDRQRARRLPDRCRGGERANPRLRRPEPARRGLASARSGPVHALGAGPHDRRDRPSRRARRHPPRADRRLDRPM